MAIDHWAKPKMKEWEKIVGKHMAGKRLIAQTYNESLHISKKDTKENLIKTWQNTRKENIQKIKWRYLTYIWKCV